MTACAVLALGIGSLSVPAAGPAVVPEPSLPPHLADLVAWTDYPTAFGLDLPERPRDAFASAIEAFLADLGLPGGSGALATAGGIPDALAGRIANLLEALRACYAETAGIVGAVGLATIVDAVRTDPTRLEPAAFAGIASCAPGVLAAMADLELEASRWVPEPQPASGGGHAVDVWPIVVVDLDGDDFYANDYLVIVELAGDDVYNNNAGSNMIDLNFSPAGSAVPGLRGTGPAEGCAVALTSLLEGDCTPVASAFLDLAGNDVYGLFEDPAEGIDARCTADPVVRRMVTIGVGFLGFGTLVDHAGNDAYNGKTGATGAGHIFGVGVQVDRAGNDRFLNVRNSQGFGLVGGIGVLRDEAGNDRYEFYLPRPLVPGTPNEQDGAGGVIDDTNACDILIRFLQGGANVGSAALLLDDAGNDVYVGGRTDDFIAPAGEGPGGSQGFANNGAFGALIDRAGSDAYRGMDGRANHVTLTRVAPSISADLVKVTVEAAEVVEFFVDR